jgi:hypothetical protein
MDESSRSRVNCYQCEHFYITWEKAFPYGCRGMGFKSRQMPSLAVFQSSGESCLLFKPKKQREKT